MHERLSRVRHFHLRANVGFELRCIGRACRGEPPFYPQRQEQRQVIQTLSERAEMFRSTAEHTQQQRNRTQNADADEAQHRAK